MAIERRLIVTGRDADGSSVFVADRPADPSTITAFPGTCRQARHAWPTKSDEPALMCQVLISAERESVARHGPDSRRHTRVGRSPARDRVIPAGERVPGSPWTNFWPST